MKIGPCRINCAEDFREDFKKEDAAFEKLFELYMDNAETFVRMFDELERDVLSGMPDWTELVRRLRCYAVGQKSTDFSFWRIEYIMDGKAEDALGCRDIDGEEDAREKNIFFWEIITREREGLFREKVSESVARAMGVYVTLHQMARCQAKKKTWNWMIDAMKKNEKKTEMERRELLLKAHAELPYFSGEKGGEDAILEIVTIRNTGFMPIQVQLSGTCLSRTVYRNQTLYALRKEGLGYTGFLGYAGENGKELELRFGCVRFTADNAAKKWSVDFGQLSSEAASHYRMPCPTADGSTVFIGRDNCLYRMDKNGNCDQIPNLQNVTIAEACVLSDAEYITLDIEGGIRSSKNDKKVIKEKGMSLALHHSVCYAQIENTVQCIAGGRDGRENERIQAWLGKKCGGKTDTVRALQTQTDRKEKPVMACCMVGGEIAAYE